MQKIIIYLSVVLLFIVGCNSENKKENNKETEVVVNILPENTENEQTKEEKRENTAIVEDIETSSIEDKKTESSGTIIATFESADLFEGEIGLHFIEKNTDKKIDFYEFDIDPEKEGLFTYKEVEGSFFPELVTNPEIKDVIFKLFWKTEIRHIDLADEDAEVKVLKSIEKIN